LKKNAKKVEKKVDKNSRIRTRDVQHSSRSLCSLDHACWLCFILTNYI